MKHFRIDGLYMRDQVFMEGDRKTPKALMFFFCDYLMLLIASWTILAMFIDALSINMDMKLTIYWLIPYSLVIFVFFLHPKYFWLKLIILITTYGYLVYHFFSWLENGFYVIENLVIDRIYEYYHYSYNYFLADYEHGVRDATVFVIFLLVFFITVLIIGMHKEITRSIAILLLSLPLILYFALGRVPSGGILILFLLSLIYYLKRPMDYKKAMSKVHQQIALILCVIVLLLYGLVSLFLSQEQYEELEGIKKLKAKVEAPFYQLTWDEFLDKVTSFEFAIFDTAVGGLDGGKLADVEEVVYTQSEQLTVLAPYASIKNGLYLKGYVGSVYTGTSWDSHEEEDAKAYQELARQQYWDAYDPFNHLSRILEMYGADDVAHRGKIKISYKGATERFLYVPYYMNVSEYQKAEPVLDLYIKPKKKKKEYEWDYIYKIDTMSPLTEYETEREDSYFQQQELYQSFVYDTYTKVPSEGMERLKGDMAKALEENSLNNFMERVYYVMEFLHSRTSYSLSPGKLPKDKDYVEYFIYENKQGYCAHYATAATLMLRKMGIPTRYVEGYAVDRTSSFGAKDDDLIERKVLDSNAHAWIEVYVDELGWISVDVTPGSNYGNNEEEANILEQETPTPEQEETIVTDTPTPTEEPTVEATLTPTPEEEKPTDAATLSPDQNSKGGDASDKDLEGKGGSYQVNQENSWLQWLSHPVIKVVGIAMIIMGILLASYRLCHWNIHRKLITTKQKGLYLYNQMERVIGFCGGIPVGKKYLENHVEYACEKLTYLEPDHLKEMVTLAQKARFQTRDFEYEDLARMRNIYQKIRYKTLSNETLIKSLGIRIILLF